MTNPNESRTFRQLATDLERLYQLRLSDALTDSEYTSVSAAILGAVAEENSLNGTVEKLETLAELRRTDVISEKVFDALKARLSVPRKPTPRIEQRASIETVPCKKCGNALTSDAASCNLCGEPVVGPTNYVRKISFAAIVMALLVAAFFGWNTSNAPSVSSGTAALSQPAGILERINGTWTSTENPYTTMTFRGEADDSFEVESNQIYGRVRYELSPDGAGSVNIIFVEPTDLGAGGARLPFGKFDHTLPLAVIDTSDIANNRITVKWNGFRIAGSETHEYETFGASHAGTYTRAGAQSPPPTEGNLSDAVLSQVPQDLGLSVQVHERCGFPPQCNAFGVLGLLDVTSHNNSPVTITRMVLNGRVGQPKCDMNANPAKTIQLGDTITIYQWIGGIRWGMVDKSCGSKVVRVDIYTNQGMETFEFQ